MTARVGMAMSTLLLVLSLFSSFQAASQDAPATVSIYWGARYEQQLVLSRSEVGAPIDIAWDASSNVVLVARSDSGRNAVTKWCAPGKELESWVIPGTIHWMSRLFRIGRDYAVEIAMERKPSGSSLPASWLAVMPPQSATALSESVRHKDFNRALNPSRDESIRRLHKRLGWSLFPGYPSFGDGYLGKLELSEIEVNAGTLALPISWTDDFSVITAGSTAEPSIYLAVRRGVEYRTFEIGSLVREAVTSDKAKQSQLALFNVVARSEGGLYCLSNKAKDPQWYIVQVELKGERPQVARTFSGLLARPLEVFRKPRNFK
jgi:hypothetical protein